MPPLPILVDFDNLSRTITRGGPVVVARHLVSLVPLGVLRAHDSIGVRLYGGWRSQGNLTNFAQQLIPSIHAECPTVFPISSNDGKTKHLRLHVELAEGPVGTTTLLQETFVRNRGLRRFRARPIATHECTRPATCGLSCYLRISHQTVCQETSCAMRLGDLLVRDEQKMVDTLLVADMAQLALVHRAPHVVIVSSDTDMWPAILLAIRNGAEVLQIHTDAGVRTQRHLVTTLSTSQLKQYRQLSI